MREDGAEAMRSARRPVGRLQSRQGVRRRVTPGRTAPLVQWRGAPVVRFQAGCLHGGRGRKAMLEIPTGLEQIAADLRSGRQNLIEHVDTLCDRIEAREPEIQALLPEPGRRERL